jgi:hypothetical protein
MENKQRFMQVGDVRGEVLMCDVIEEGAAYMELPASECYLDFVLLTDRARAIDKQARDVPRIGWCVDRYHCARLGNTVRGGQHGRTAEAVADENRGCGECLAQVVRCGDEILDVGGERGVGELAFAAAEASEIKTQHGYSVLFQAVGDAPCGSIVLAAGEAMRKQRDRACPRCGAVEQCSELQALGIVEVKPLGRHLLPPEQHLIR